MSDADRLVANLRRVPVRLPKELEVRQLCRSLGDLLAGEANLLSLQILSHEVPFIITHEP